MNTRRSGWTSAVPNARELRSRRSPRLHRHSASRALQEDEGDVERALSAARIAAHPTRKFSSGTVDGRPAIVRALAVVTRAARVRHVLGVRNVLGHANAMVARHGNPAYCGALSSGWRLHYGNSVSAVDAPTLLVHCAMVRPAQGDQVRKLSGTAVRPVDDVVAVNPQM